MRADAVPCCVRSTPAARQWKVAIEHAGNSTLSKAKKHNRTMDHLITIRREILPTCIPICYLT